MSRCTSRSPSLPSRPSSSWVAGASRRFDLPATASCSSRSGDGAPYLSLRARGAPDRGGGARRSAPAAALLRGAADLAGRLQRQPPADPAALSSAWWPSRPSASRGSWPTTVIPAVTWPAAFTLGAVVAPPDAVAATAIAQTHRHPTADRHHPRGGVASQRRHRPPSVVILLALVLAGSAAGVTQIRIEEAARGGARALARGAPAAEVGAIVHRLGGEAAGSTVALDGDLARRHRVRPSPRSCRVAHSLDA